MAGRWSALALVTLVLGACAPGDWRTASRDSAGIAPDPQQVTEALVQVYAARAWSWRGWFGVHTWIAAKPTNAEAFTVYEVIGWRAYHGMSAVSVSQRPADGRWFGAEPKVIAELRGPGTDAVIQRIDQVARAYPYPDEYTVWPGPNSNTFTAWVGRHVPELRLDLPPTAIGKDYLPHGDFAAPSPSGSGWQVSLFGLAGLTVGKEEGLEINLLGLVFGIDPLGPAVKLPLVGRVGA
ncbi:DUF3750 domain-containing protein [Magnetospira sp. QH-2]|uniref:DUF3750 domain-containing protein n=1 Tax=Magnetospira sp. (strain QH-2) TaxID=1288970 RepID=UPI0003E80F87|nr:DUF3750 domain-containing protein [Magnetospira sp. QH-2]CCQ72291.1 conserved protein of unknown function [Magnetospira sp. QH-2]